MTYEGGKSRVYRAETCAFLVFPRGISERIIRYVHLVSYYYYSFLKTLVTQCRRPGSPEVPRYHGYECAVNHWYLSPTPPPYAVNPSAMGSPSAALAEVDDVLRIIFRCFCPSPELKTSGGFYSVQVARRSLASAAVSCKALSHHALDILWESLPSDTPLLRLMDVLGLTHMRVGETRLVMIQAKHVSVSSLLCDYFSNSCYLFTAGRRERVRCVGSFPLLCSTGSQDISLSVPSYNLKTAKME